MAHALTPSGRVRPAPRRERLTRLRSAAPLLAVLGAYAVTIALLPRADIPVGDDWVYARSVRILLDEHRLHILDASVVTLVFQLLWGALFSSVLGLSFVSLRLSSVVLVGGGAVAVFALCRALGAGRGWSALAAAAWLFNPLTYVLGNSFMTDASFAALLAMASFLYVRGLDPERESPRLVVCGSVVAALAFLVRQQGLLIPGAVLAFLLLSKRLTADRQGGVLGARVAAVPAAAAAVYWLWLGLVHGVPAGQRMFADELGLLWRWDTPRFLGELLTVHVMYAGLFALPVAVAAVVVAPRIARAIPPKGLLVLAPVVLVVVVGGLALATQDRLMPYVPQFLAPWGLGPADLQGGRPELVGRNVLVLLTLLVAGAAIVGAACIGRRAAGSTGSDRAGAGLLAAILAGQVAGTLPPSLHFQNPVPAGILTTTLDRYLLPVLPLVLCLTVWAVARMRVPPWPAWVVTGVLAIVAVAGTRDFLVFQRTVWDVAAAANAAGIENHRLDAGAQWDGEHLYRDWSDMPPSRPDRPWWVNLFAWTTDSSFVVASQPLPGHVVVRHTTYDTWLPPRERSVVLLRREDVPPLSGETPPGGL